MKPISRQRAKSNCPPSFSAKYKNHYKKRAARLSRSFHLSTECSGLGKSLQRRDYSGCGSSEDLYFSAVSLISVCSSPRWYISITMSQPPTSSPSTHSCGKVGQLAYFGISARISGFCKISTYAKRSPQAERACTACAEKPQLGNFGEPFMYRRIGFSETCF